MSTELHQPTFTAGDIVLVSEHLASEHGATRAAVAALKTADELKDSGDIAAAHIWQTIAFAIWAPSGTPDEGPRRDMVRWWNRAKADISEALQEALQDAMTGDTDLRFAAAGVLKARPWQDLTDAEKATVAALWFKLRTQIPKTFRPEMPT